MKKEGIISFQEGLEIRDKDHRALVKAKKREKETANDYEWIKYHDNSLRRVRKDGEETKNS